MSRYVEILHLKVGDHFIVATRSVQDVREPYPKPYSES